MTEIITHPLAIDGKDPRNARGDRISQDRYYSREWFAALAARYGWQIDVAEQWLAGYGNAPYRFNVMLTPQSR